MKPLFTLLNDSTVDQIIDEGMQLLMNPGVRVHNKEAISLLLDAGVQVDVESQIAKIPESIVSHALESAPGGFTLFNLSGEPAVEYRDDQVHFDPGSAAITVLDREKKIQRTPVTKDFVQFVQLVEALPQLDAQSTSMICSDVPEEIGDLYRLYLALLYATKPIITGAFRKDTWWTMYEMLVAVSGDSESLRQKPIAVFDVCPSPPLLWSDLTCQNLIDCARTGLPAELVSMPLAGATSPVTLAAAVVQHTAECLSGVVIHQLANAGSPIVWGGSPSVFDMRHGTTPMGAVGTWMIDSAYSQVGKSLGLPTHAYLGMTDAKIVDAQSGLESAGGAIIAALSGINMVSGAGMMDFESCQSFEKLVIDAEIIGMVKRLIQGIDVRDDPIALGEMRRLGHRAEYLAQPHTLEWFAKEQYIPSPVIDRGSYDAWSAQGRPSTWDRASARVDELLADFHAPGRTAELDAELGSITLSAARKFGLDRLPKLPTN
ncbi:MAG: trimethylamine methyltransferase family protein [Chloroflexota bacterium]